MNRDDQLRAIVATAVGDQRSAIIEVVAEALHELYPTWPHVDAAVLITNAQMSTIQTAAAWHRSQTSAHARLDRLHAELKRVQTNVSHDRAQFYRTLEECIWGNNSLLWRIIRQTIDNDPELTDPERLRLRSEARLALALSILDTVTAALTTRSLQIQLTEHEGGWQWP